jgi:uncharacterized protein (TIGR03382 family)
VSYDVNGDGDFDDSEDVVDTAKPCDSCTPCNATVTYDNNRQGDLAYRVLVSVIDEGAGDSVATAIVSVTVRNVDPVLTAVGAQTVEEDVELALTLSATDVGVDDVLSYSYVSGPSGVTVDSSTGALSWTPGYADEGVNTLTVGVSDGEGGSAQTQFSVTVTIVDTNGNGVSDNQEIDLTGGLLPDGSDTADTDMDGVTDLQEVLDGTNPNETDAPGAPVVISPDGESVDTATPILTVANATSPRDLPLTYTFVVEDDQGAEVGREDTDVEVGETTTSVTFDAATLTEDATYTWYAFANDGLADGASSEDGVFTVDAVNVAPPVPENLTPADAATFAAGSFVGLEVRAVTDADGDAVWYGFEVSTTAAFATADVVATSELRAVPFFTVPSALDVGTYYWRAWATDGTNDSATSTATTFVIEEGTLANLPPSAPSIVSPDGTTVGATTATLEVGAGTDPEGETLEYEFEIADNAAFAGATASGRQAGLTYDATGLTENADYYWRARAYDGVLYSDWVSATFTVDAANDPPTGLAILSPSDGSLLDAVASFVVQNATDPDGDDLTYSFSLSENDDLSSPMVEETVTEGDGVTEWTPAASAFTVTAGETYYWGVTVSDGTNPISVSGAFTLADLTGTGPGTQVPDDGCGCNASHQGKTAPLAGVLALLGLVAVVRRRRR